jgi:hypothetical protein
VNDLGVLGIGNHPVELHREVLELRRRLFGQLATIAGATRVIYLQLDGGEVAVCMIDECGRHYSPFDWRGLL